ncbi:DNA methyltransferase [Methylobacterium sp. WSM2598]|uniref:DNA methyltransferase n=1 Tax=Methylobacterium sp. WSM2598 TaxID=398261 RepID=UPI00039F7B6B|nr:DNA methyltransferase [Methylobacterium sp. WSM2598]
MERVTAEFLKDVLKKLTGPASPAPAEKPRLKTVKGRAKHKLKLLDPATLNNPKWNVRNEVEWVICNDDALEGLKRLPDRLVDCVVTSPPYYWQRDYGIEGQTGHEDTVQAYVDTLVAVFREVRRVLKPRGTLFLNLGDTYYSGNGQPSITVAFLCVLADGWPGLASGAAAAVWRLTRAV